MNLDKITAGENLPDDINVVIEIPSHDYPVKYELDKESGALIVDRFMNTAMFYPCNYGFVPNTLAEDGDPVDVLVVTPVPVIAGSVIRCRPVGMLKMTDEAGPDVKVLAVPVDKLHSRFSNVHSPSDLPMDMLAQITHFFEQYKQLEPDKWVRVEEWAGAEEAKAELVAGEKRYQKSKV